MRSLSVPPVVRSMVSFAGNDNFVCVSPVCPIVSATVNSPVKLALPPLKLPRKFVDRSEFICTAS